MVTTRGPFVMTTNVLRRFIFLFACDQFSLYCLGARHAAGFIDCMVAVIPKRTAYQVKREVKAMKTAAKQINKSPAAARKFLRENGFITRQNKVSAHYR
jgi:hypothetical protein